MLNAAHYHIWLGHPENLGQNETFIDVPSPYKHEEPLNTSKYGEMSPQLFDVEPSFTASVSVASVV